MSDDLKKLFGGRARVIEGGLPQTRGPEKKKKEPVSEPVSPVEKQPVLEQESETSFADMFDQPEEDVVLFCESVDTTLKDKELASLALEKAGPAEHPSNRGIHYKKPQEELDLHGMTAAQAELRVEAYIMDAHCRRLVTVRIITGKGTHSPRGPVLPEVVAATLNKLKKRGLVGAVQYEKKGGSVLVFLAE